MNNKRVKIARIEIKRNKSTGIPYLSSSADLVAGNQRREVGLHTPNYFERKALVLLASQSLSVHRTGVLR